MAKSIVWLRRDLRLNDNRVIESAIQHAGTSGLIFVFIVDLGLVKSAGPRRQELLYALLKNLNCAIESRFQKSLNIFAGDPTEVLKKLAGESSGDTRVFAAQEFTPRAIMRDQLVEQNGLPLKYADSPYVVNPGTLYNKSDKPYQVFTPFYKAWANSSQIRERAEYSQSVAHASATGAAAAAATGGDVASVSGGVIASGTSGVKASGLSALNSIWDSFNLSRDLSLLTKNSDWLYLNEQQALTSWHRFRDEMLYADKANNSKENFGYDRARNLPGTDGTSRLSIALKWGLLHPRTLLKDFKLTTAWKVFESELCWREFYADVLFHNPTSAYQDLKPIPGMTWDEGQIAKQRFERWCQGKTGYPIVDAGMVQLREQGWMHNRVRMIAASFLVKDLHLPWQWGAKWFMDNLFDADLASNQHGWQWVAGTGTDASPYFRVFNPTTQGEKFDPDGSYVKKWIVQLNDLEPKLVHRPWNVHNINQLNVFEAMHTEYPDPLIDHDDERKEALKRYSRERSFKE